MSRVYIGKLSYRAREKDLERFFKSYGKIVDLCLKNGYGFIEFDDFRDAEDAVYELNGKELCGERVTLEHAKGYPKGRDQRRDTKGGSSRRDRDRGRRMRGRGPASRSEHRVLVENLSTRVTWQELKDYMKQAGDVAFADAHKQRRNEGVVEFFDASSIKRAIDKFDGAEINGRKIKIIDDRRDRSDSRSRSRSRSAGSAGGGAAVVGKENKRASKSRSRSKSPGGSGKGKSKRDASRSRSRSRSGSTSKKRMKKSSKSGGSRSRSRSRSRSKSPVGGGAGGGGHSRSRSRSPRGAAHSRSRSRSRSRSAGDASKEDGTTNGIRV